MNALSITFGGLKSAQDRFETSARRIVSSGAEASNAFTQSIAEREGVAGGQPSPAASETSATSSGTTSAGPLSSDMTRAMIDMLQAEISFKANAKVAGRLQDMQRAYLDMASGPTNRG